MHIEVLPVEGLPLIEPGMDLAEEICRILAFEDDDILCVASSVYSKAEGHVRDLETVVPGERACRIAELCGEEPRFIQVILEESTDVIIEHPFILSELPSGHIGVRAGVDHSNIATGMVILLPPEPMKAAEKMRTELEERTGKEIRVIITDTCGRSFRRGQTGTAIGWSGMPAIMDYRGDVDLFGHTLEITEEAVVDEIAGFANFIMGESNRGVPAVVFRNCPHWQGHDDLYFKSSEDLTRKALKKD